METLAKVISFVVPAIPVAQPRQRHRVATINGRPMSMNYTPTKHPSNAFKATVRMAAQQAIGLMPPLSGPLNLKIVFIFPRPSSRIWKKRPMPREPHTKKPDIDNVLKAFTDCLNQVMWYDDSQICEVVMTKFIASGSEVPHVEVCITTIKEESDGQGVIAGI